MASSCSSTEKRNFQCITVASVDLIKLPLRDIFDSHIKPVDLYHKIQSCSTLKLRPDQLKICLVPPPGVPDYNTFDITLLYTLIRNLCSLPCPAQGWGNEPKTTDTQISDDIERLRLFRNIYYAHAESAVISNAKFEDVWKNLKLIFKRIQPKLACSIDYEEQLIHIERTKFTDDYLTTFRVLLEALVTFEKQTDNRDEPTVSIRGENEIMWGDTAHFEADVKKADSSCWSITWHRRRGDDIKYIDTTVEKYSGSTKRKLVINSVSKEDEGEYQALLSFESKGPDYKSRNTIRLHVIGDVPSVRIFVDSPVCFGSETIIKSVVSSTLAPEQTEWQKSKDGTDFHLIRKSYIYLESTEHFKNPFLVIPKTTFADKHFYRLLVWNRVGKSASNRLYLNVTGSPPNITTSFVTNINNKSVQLMGEVYFLENSPGILKTFWTKNGEKIDIKESDGKLSEMINDNPSLTITNVGADDAGEYRVTAVNDVGSTTSEVIVLGIPSVFSERVEDEINGGRRITVTITSFPAPCQIRWNAKSKDDDTFTPIDINADEYNGTTVTFPHPMLVVRQRDQLENNCYQIEVTNFIGKIVQTISGNNKPTVRKKDIVQNTFYKDRGARVRFTKLSNILAKEFPPQKLEILKFTLTNSNIVQNRTSVMEATSALQCIRILQDEELFTQTDVIVMQFLCTQTDCLDLHAKCVEYAEQQKALCYFEKPPVNGYKNAQFHVKGDLFSYTKDFIQDVIETVAAILDCKVEDILLNGVRHSKSFLLSLAVKDVYLKKLLALNEQERLRLVRLNIDYLIIDKETLNLERPKAAYLGLRTTQSFKERSPSDVSAPLSAISDWFEPDDKQVDRHHAALYRKSLPHASKGIQEETEQERLPPGQYPGPLTGMAEEKPPVKRNKTGILKEPILELMCHCCNKILVNPVYLPCGHTIDKQCVNKQNPFGKCPVCKQYFTGQAQSFPENSFLQRLADVARCRKFTAKLLSNPSCNFVEHRVAVVASAICAMCKLQLCERCKSLHDKVPGAKKHEMYLSNNGGQEKIIIDMENICKYHDGKRIIFWCSECKLPACTDCCPCDHRLVDVSKAAKVEEDKIRGLQREIENSLPDIEFQLKIINESEKKIKSQNDDDHFSSFALRFNNMKGSVEDVYLQCLYLRDEIKKILAFGGDIELLTAIKFFVIQHENLRKMLKSIEQSSQSSFSSDRSSSSNPHSSVLDERQSLASDNSIYTKVALDYQHEMFNVGSQKKRREAVVIPQNEKNIYMNELPYDELEVQLRKPPNDTSMEITEKFCEFDTEIRITGMTLLDDTIMITSRSAGLCAGYTLSGQRKWTITDKLNGPFDLDSYRSDNGEQLLFITDPGKTDDSKSTVMVYLRKKNDRYTHLTRFTNECVQPRGVCVYAGKVYVCEPQSHRMTEYQICKDFKGKIVKIYKEQNVLKEPMYVSAQILSGKIFLIISDKEMGLKRLEKGESGSDSPGWAVSNEKSFTPSKCAITKQEGSHEVFVGNSAGRKIHLVNFKPRQISHREYSMEDVNKPVAISVDNQGRIVVACMDGTVLLYEVKEAVEMKRLSNYIKEESIYDL